MACAQDVAVEPATRTLRVPGTTVEFEMVRCPAGVETTPDGETVEVGELWVLSTEVTWDLYDVFVFALDEADAGPLDAVSRPSKPYVPPDRGYGHAGYPAIGMTRAAAESFCAWLEARTGIEARLPTQSEWMYLARGAKEPTSDTSSSDDLDRVAWYESNTSDTTEPVGGKEANAFGLHDMLGNAAEWVITDTRKPIAMGGSFRDPADECTAESSQRQHSSWNTSDPQIPKSAWWLADCGWVGFRFVVDAEGEDSDEQEP